MSPLLSFYLMALLTSALPTQASTKSSLEQIKNSCRQKAAALKALSANIAIATDSVINHVQIQSRAIGKYEHLHHDGRLLFRVELKNTVTQVAYGQTALNDQDVLTIFDGRYAYTLSTTAGQPPSATRNLPNPGQTVLADDAFFAGLEREYVVRVLPDETIESRQVWVIEASPKTRSPGRPAKTIYYLTKDSGVRIRSTSHDASGKRVQLTDLTNLQINPPLKPERFIFKPPPGVHVVDLSPTQ